MHVVTAAQMRDIEAATVAAGSTWAALMERAGAGVAAVIQELCGTVAGMPVLVLVGGGNNGGDGLVIARHLHDAGARVALYIWQREATTADHDANWHQCRQRDIHETLAADDPDLAYLHRLLADAALIVDALLGSGANRPLAGVLAAIVAAANATRQQRSVPVVAVDLPTGIHADTGRINGVALAAQYTVATGLLKRGLLLYPGRSYAGNIRVVPIGIAAQELETVMSTQLTRDTVRPLLPARPEDAHKGTFGKLLVVAGSLAYPGAAALATTAAARSGAGLVTLAAPRAVLGLVPRAPEITLLPLADAAGVAAPTAAETIRKKLEGYAALLIGCGLDTEEPIEQFFRRLLGFEQPRTAPRVGFRTTTADQASPQDPLYDPANLPPTVIDADGLNLLAQIEAWHTHLPAGRCILTPHPGEMRRLLGGEEMPADPVQTAADAAQQWQQVVVLKGATTVIATPDGSTQIAAAGNPALATAGTGDVLAGVLAGLLAQGVAPAAAAALGVYLHSAAGALLRDELGDSGTLASDLLPRLPLAIKALKAE